MTRRDSTVLILGGAGLVGMQCAKKIAMDLRPERIVITSLYRKETLEAVDALKREFSQIDIAGYYGNLFVRGNPISIEERVAEPSPPEFIDAPQNRREIFSDIFLDFETAYQNSMLARLLLLVRPDAIVDSVNTATGISYQDVFSSAFVVSRGLEEAQRRDSRRRSPPISSVTSSREQFPSSFFTPAFSIARCPRSRRESM